MKDSINRMRTQVPEVPPFNVTSSSAWTRVVSRESESKCNGRPDVIFTITVNDLCQQTEQFQVRYNRIDETAPQVSVADPEDVSFVLECGATKPQVTNFNFISFADDCSPRAVTCSAANNIQFFPQCSANKQIGSAQVGLLFADGAGNQTPGPIQNVAIVDTSPPHFKAFNYTSFNVEGTCDQFPLDRLPPLQVEDRCACSDGYVTISDPVPTELGCGIVRWTWTATDKCQNQGTTSFLWIFEEKRKAPTVSGLSETIDIDLDTYEGTSIDVVGSDNLRLVQPCFPDFDFTDLFVSQPVRVSVEQGPIVPPSGQMVQFSKQITLTWTVDYCSDNSTFEQLVTVTSSTEQPLNQVSIAPIDNERIVFA